MKTSWQGINEFVSVAELSSFTRASEKLGISVVKVSRMVSNLEEHLGVKLLQRTTRKVSLTEAGQRYYQQCKPLIEGLELAELEITKMQSSPTGLLKITAPITYGEEHIGPLILEFMKRYPKVSVDLTLTNQQLDLVEMGIDVAIRLGQLENSGLVAKRLASRQLFVCASPEYITQFGKPQTLAELKNHNCLMGSIDRWRFQENNREKSLKVTGNFKSNSGSLTLDAGKRGLGLLQLPDYYVRESLNNGTLIEVLRKYRVNQEGIWAVFMQNRHLSHKVRLLIDFLAEEL